MRTFYYKANHNIRTWLHKLIRMRLDLFTPANMSLKDPPLSSQSQSGMKTRKKKTEKWKKNKPTYSHNYHTTGKKNKKPIPYKWTKFIFFSLFFLFLSLPTSSCLFHVYVSSMRFAHQIEYVMSFIAATFIRRWTTVRFTLIYSKH